MDLFTSISLLRHLFLLSSLLLSSSLVLADRNNNSYHMYSVVSSRDLSTQKQCVHDHFSALHQLKQGFDLSNTRSDTLSSWNPDNRDCCSWEGIMCTNGHVTRLDLSNLHISGQIDSHNISHLWSLQRLNLAHNWFFGAPFRSGLGQLTSLTHLNFSSSGFDGQIPMEISRLTNLVSLDLYFYYPRQKLKNPTIGSLVKNLTSLRELHLNYVNISVEGKEWGQALSSLHHLHKLSLRGCSLSGPIHSSLSQLHFLTELDLSYNNLSSVVLDFIGNYSYLTSLHLINCGLRDRFPNTIFKLPSLKTLDVSLNLLTTHLPKFPLNSSLQQLDLSNMAFSGKFPNSLSNLKFLTELRLRNCNFSGPLPSSLAKITRLEYLDLSFNNFSGSIPFSYGNELLNLKEILLRGNLLSGTIPSSLFALPSLQVLDLARNQLGGPLGEFYNASYSQLEEIYLGYNSFLGMIPRSIFEFKKLMTIYLSSNNFSGDVDLGLFINLKNLYYIDLSDNSLSVKDSSGNSTFDWFPQLDAVSLRSCNISEFPSFLRYQDFLREIDLSNNLSNGEIPQWIWKIGSGYLDYLNLSHNVLHGIKPPISNISLSRLILDLSSNKIEGSFLIPRSIMLFFSISNNRFIGEIPMSICNATNLQMIDLSHNYFSGWIPPCLGEMKELIVLNLRGNFFHGTLNQTFIEGRNLRTIDVSGNQLEGQLPRSLSNCKRLEVLDLGNNHLHDTFPSWLGEFPQLRVLVLRSNQFFGPIKYPLTNNPFPLLQIIDLSSNNFTDSLSSNIFQSWKAMIEGGKSQHYMFLNKSFSGAGYYQDKVTIVSKGLKMELVKILNAYTVVSNNGFQRNIPESIGDQKSLLVLNMSYNHFTGRIPTSFENMMALESLDLSHNKLLGNIPWQLTKLTFLAVLDLSQNLLEGSIPQDRQFLTFPKESFVGNLGLCGPPLLKKCEDGVASLPPAQSESSQSTYDWEFIWIGFGVGYGVGLGILLWTLVLWAKGRREFYVIIDRMLC